VLAGGSSVPVTFIIQNAAPAATPLALSTTGPFQILSSTCGATLAANASCNANLAFAPPDSGPFSGTFVATGSGGASTSSLSGNGVRQPAASLPTSPIDFGSLVLGSAPVSRTVALSSTGNEILAINSISASPPFTLSTTCGVSLQPATSCNITVGFNPAAIGDFGGFLSVSTNAPGASFIQVPVHGAVQVRPEPLVRVSPRVINFGARFAGSAAPPQNVTVTNEGGAAANLTVTLEGLHFSIVHSSCGASLSPGASCGLQLGFAPQGFGPKSADLLVSSNSPDSPQGVGLTGASCRPPPVTQSRGATSLNCSP
jgi:hypothetical protein